MTSSFQLEALTFADSYSTARVKVRGKGWERSPKSIQNPPVFEDAVHWGVKFTIEMKSWMYK